MLCSCLFMGEDAMAAHANSFSVLQMLDWMKPDSSSTKEETVNPAWSGQGHLEGAYTSCTE